MSFVCNFQSSQGAGDNKEKRRKESILDLSKYLEKSIRVKFAGGREAAGILKGYDPLLNLVLDNTTEFLRGKLTFMILTSYFILLAAPQNPVE